MLNFAKTSLAVFFLLVFGTIVSCSKSNSGPDEEDPDVDPKPMRVAKITSKIDMHDGTYLWDSTRFSYTDEGALTRQTNLRSGHYTEYVYSNNIVTKMLSYSNTGALTNTFENYIRSEDNGNTIIVDYSRGKDTVILTYKFSGDVIQSYRLHLHVNDQPTTDDLYTFSYDAAGNLQQCVRENNLMPTETYTVLAVDDKKNPNYQNSKMNIVLTTGQEFFTKGKNNPTRVRDQLGNIREYEWTYNSNGYPATLKETPGSSTLMFEYNQ